MQLRSSLLPSVASASNQQGASMYAARLVARSVPGERIVTAQDHCYEVRAKFASATGMVLRLKRLGANSPEFIVAASGLARLQPVPQGIRRFAANVIKFAFDQNLGLYVTSAIEHHGLPLDPKINWTKWIEKVYRPALNKLTKDEDLQDDAIREVITQRLFNNRVLDNFNPDHPALTKEEGPVKVTAYLAYILKKSVPEAQDYIRRAKGVGMWGTPGRTPAESLVRGKGEDEGEYQHVKVEPSGEDERLSEDEVNRFVDAFKTWIKQNTPRKNTAVVLNWITDQVRLGESRLEIREHLMQHDDLKARDGQNYNEQSFKKLIAQWAREIRRFAEAEDNPYRDSAVSKIIATRSSKLLGEDKMPPGTEGTGEQKITARWLNLAQDDTGILPHAPYSQTTDPTIPVDQKPVPPKNPNVQQQENAANKNMMQQQQQQQLGQDDQDFQKPGIRVTIPPEIPGVNHA